MATQVQNRRGTTAEHSTFTGAVGEVTIDTDKDTAVVHDGSTAGGRPLLREDGSNSALALGSAATPSLKFTGDANTGIYSPGADQLALSTNGTERMRITSAGLVGVGTSSPNFRIHSGIDLGTQSPLVRQVGAVIGSSYTRSDNSQFVGRRIALGAIDYSACIQGEDNGGSPTNLAINPSGGSVGIGTSSPAYRLSISEASGTQSALGLTSGASTLIIGSQDVGSGRSAISYSNNAGGSNNILSLGFGAVTSGVPANPVINLTQAGNVGIGTTSPNSALDIYRASATDVYITTGNTTASWLTGVATGGDYNIYSNNASNIRFTTNASERARIDSSGRLLVGTSSAFDSTSIQTSGSSAGLSVLSGNDPVSLTRFSSSSFGPFIFLNKSRSGTIGTNTIVVDGDDLGGVLFRGGDGTNYVSAARIAAQVDGTPGTNDMPGRLVFSTTADGASSPTERMRIDNKGSLSLWTPGNTTASPQDVDARAFFYNDGTSSGLYIDSRNSSSFVHINQSFGDSANRGAIAFYRNESQKGSISVDSSQVYYNTTSDYRLKENITELTGAVQKLSLLKPSRFNFIEAPDRTVDGFIAHEVQEVIPEAVTGQKDQVDDDGNPIYQGIDQSKLVPLLTAALQEAIGEIESLKARVAVLEAN